MNKELKKLMQALQSQGFEVTQRKSGHLMVRSADGKHQAVMALTGSDRRGWKNSLARLRRMGFEG